MFERGFCRDCGESQELDPFAMVSPHERRGHMCSGSGEPPAADPAITFWRASSEDDAYILVSRGQEHAEDLIGYDPDEQPQRLKLIKLDDEEILDLAYDRIITGSVISEYDETTMRYARRWAVGTIAVERR